MEKVNKHRINAYISNDNYNKVSDLMENEELINMKLSKGAILDLALSNLFDTLESKSLKSIAIKHLEGVDA